MSFGLSEAQRRALFHVKNDAITHHIRKGKDFYRCNEEDTFYPVTYLTSSCRSLRKKGLINVKDGKVYIT